MNLIWTDCPSKRTCSANGFLHQSLKNNSPGLQSKPTSDSGLACDEINKPKFNRKIRTSGKCTLDQSDDLDCWKLNPTPLMRHGYIKGQSFTSLSFETTKGNEKQKTFPHSRLEFCLTMSGETCELGCITKCINMNQSNRNWALFCIFWPQAVHIWMSHTCKGGKQSTGQSQFCSATLHVFPLGSYPVSIWSSNVQMHACCLTAACFKTNQELHDLWVSFPNCCI